VYKNLPAKRDALEKYLRSVFQTDVNITGIQELKDSREKVKESRYGVPLRIDVDVAGIQDQILLHTIHPDHFGYEKRADRARSVILDYDSFNHLDQHVLAIGMGAFRESGTPISLHNTQEFFLITRYVPGRLFAEDLENLSTASQLLPEDRQRVLSLAKYLAEIHATKHEKPSLYERGIRDLFGHGEGILSLIDQYPSDLAFTSPSRLQAIERNLIDWRWRLKARAHRLSQVHGNFHPWNILFQKDNEFTVLNRSRGEWGEPADDISALSINFISFSLQQHGTLRGVYRVLFDLFWEGYLQDTQDIELNRVIQPFYVWRALSLANPVWYPDLTIETREKLFNFIENLLAEDWFDPGKINNYLGRNDP
jgi:hypothetical protein